MRKPELRIVRFESGDVIAASGNAPVCLVLKNFGNGNTADNTLMIENGPYNGQYVQNINSNSQRATNQIIDNAVALINKAFGISTVSKDTRFFIAMEWEILLLTTSILSDFMVIIFLIS